jgi:serine 3-dehydrogenase
MTTFQDIAGSIALVTGASSGVGRAAALALARSGACVYAVARRASMLQQLAAESSRISAIAVDLTDRCAVDKMADKLRKQIPHLDIMVCAAGTNVPQRRLDQLTYEDWQRIMETNVTGTFNVIQSCLDLLRRAKGHILIIASVSSRWPDASGVAYQASKRAVLGLAHAVSLEERDHGVRVSAVLPGLIDTPLLDQRPAPPPKEVREHALKAEDIAEICVFLSRLHSRIFVPEMVVMPTALERIGHM